MTTKADILLAIRHKCLDCSAGQPSEVRNCHLTSCALWPYRLGSDPLPGKARGCAKQPLQTGNSLIDEHGAAPPSLDDASLAKIPLVRGDFAEGATPL
jgi:hypothetical protein